MHKIFAIVLTLQLVSVTLFAQSPLRNNDTEKQSVELSSSIMNLTKAQKLHTKSKVLLYAGVIVGTVVYLNYDKYDSHLEKQRTYQAYRNYNPVLDLGKVLSISSLAAAFVFDKLGDKRLKESGVHYTPYIVTSSDTIEVEKAMVSLVESEKAREKAQRYLDRQNKKYKKTLYKE